MRKSMPFLILPALILSTVDHADAQGRGGGGRIQQGTRSKEVSKRSRSGFNPRTTRYRPSASFTNGFRGTLLRSEQVRNALSDILGGPRQGLLPQDQWWDPVYTNLYYRNLLRSRSPIAVRTMQLAGRKDYVRRNGDWAGETSTPEVPVSSPALQSVQGLPGHQAAVMPEPIVAEEIQPLSMGDRTYNDMLERRLQEKAERSFAKGMALSRERDFLGASQAFEVCRYLPNMAARSDAALTLVAFQAEDYNEASIHLSMALRRMESLEQIQLNPRDFFSEMPAFSRAVDQVGLMAESQPNVPGLLIMVAFFEWLDGDTSTAITALDNAVLGMEREIKAQESTPGQASPVDRTIFARKFRTMLIESTKPAQPAGAEAEAPQATSPG